MLVEGVAPRHIAAVTFTELAASELLLRIRETAYALGSGLINMLIENRPNGPVGVNFSRQTLATGATCISGFANS